MGEVHDTIRHAEIHRPLYLCDPARTQQRPILLLLTRHGEALQYLSPQRRQLSTEHGSKWSRRRAVEFLHLHSGQW